MGGVDRGIRKLVLAIACAMFLATTTLIAAIAIHPLPLPFMSHYLQDLLEHHYHAYDVEFDEARLRWRPFNDSLDIQFESVRAMEFDGEIIATIPKVVLGVALAPILRGDLEILNVSVQGAKIQLFRTAGGAVKFDIGSKDDGSSGKILEYILTDIAAAPVTLGELLSFPSVSVLDADLTFRDENSGTFLRIPDADVRLQPDPKGVRSTYDLQVAAGGDRLRFSAESLFKTSDQSIDLNVVLDRIRPSVLAEILPRLGYLAPFEIPLSGNIRIQLDKFFAVSSASFDVAGEAGSLEIAEYSGLNLYLDGMRAKGRATDGVSHLDLTKLQLDLGRATVTLTGLLTRSDQTLAVTMEFVVVDTSLISLMPRWFAQLENALDRRGTAGAEQPDVTLLSFDGRYHLGERVVQGKGLVSYRDKVASEEAVGAKSEMSPTAAREPSTQFMVSGSIDAPNFVIATTETAPDGTTMP